MPVPAGTTCTASRPSSVEEATPPAARERERQNRDRKKVVLKSRRSFRVCISKRLLEKVWGKRNGEIYIHMLIFSESCVLILAVSDIFQ